MDSRRTPQRVLAAHPSDQCSQFCCNRRSPSQLPGFPAPVATKAVAMPAQERVRLDDAHHLKNRREPAIKLNEEQPIAVCQRDTTTHLALQDDHLLPQHGVLSFKSALR